MHLPPDVVEGMGREPEPSSRRGNARLSVVLVIGMCTGTFTAYVMAVLGPYLTEEFGLSRTAFGSLSTVLFAIAAASSVLIGRMADRLGGKWLLMGTFIMYSAGAVLLSAAQSVSWLVASVVLGGVALATTNPATNQLIAARTAVSQRGWMTGIKQSGGQLSAIVAGVALPTVAVAVGWRSAVWVLIAFAMFGLLLTWRIIPDDDQREGAVIRSNNKRRQRRPLPKEVWWLALYSLAMAAGGGAVVFYIPLYVFEEFSVSAAVAGLATGIVGVVGTVARILWGPLSQRFAAVSMPLVILGLLSMLAALLLWAAPQVGIGLMWAGVVVYGLSAAAWTTVAMLGVITVTDATQAGRASGVVLLASYLGGIASPTLFGYAVDTSGSYAAGWSSVLSLFAIALISGGWWHYKWASLRHT